jgi:hypothetical protein
MLNAKKEPHPGIMRSLTIVSILDKLTLIIKMARSRRSRCGYRKRGKIKAANLPRQITHRTSPVSLEISTGVPVTALLRIIL